MKAPASRSYEPALHSHESADCHLCEGKLTGDKRAALADEIASLKEAASVAEWRLVDVCTEHEKSIRDSVPQAVDAHFGTSSAMRPRHAFSEAAKQVFVQPLGMSGARIAVTLAHQLERTGGQRGLATLCIGVGTPRMKATVRRFGCS